MLANSANEFPALTVILSGIIISKTGFFAPVIIVGAVVTTVGCGLLYTLDLHSSPGAWVGYQVIAGLGIGTCFQAPIMVGQALAEPEDISTTTAILLCECSQWFKYQIVLAEDADSSSCIIVFQTIGASVFVSCGQSVFLNQLLERTIQLSPGIDRATLVLTGASELRHVFRGAQLEAVLEGYLWGVRCALLTSLALVAASTLSSLLIPWWNIGKRVDQRQAEAETS